MKVNITQTYNASDIRFSEVYEFAEGRVDIQLDFKTDNPFEPVSLSFQIDKNKCREIAERLLAIADKLDNCNPPKITDFESDGEDPADSWKKPTEE